MIFVLKVKFSFKIAAPGEGRKPSCEEYIAESKFAWLDILSKEYLIIHFYLDPMDSRQGSRNNKHLIFSDAKRIARMREDSLKQPCVIIANLQNIFEIRLEDI